MSAFAMPGSLYDSAGALPPHLPPLGEAHAALRAMVRSPKPLARPVLVLNGYRSVSPFVAGLVRTLAAVTSGDIRDFVLVSYATKATLSGAVERCHAMLRAQWGTRPGASAGGRSLDAVGMSMGGVVARVLAEPECLRHASGTMSGQEVPPPIRFGNIFTLGSPHQGAALALKIAPDAAAMDLRPGSRLLDALNSGRTQNAPTLCCYAQLRDAWVGASRSAPPNHPVIWSPGTRILSHFTTAANPWFTADIARRLRGEEAFVREPFAVLPRE